MLLESKPLDGPAPDSTVTRDHRPPLLADDWEPVLVIRAPRDLRQPWAARKDDVDSDLSQGAADLQEVLVYEPPADGQRLRGRVG